MPFGPDGGFDGEAAALHEATEAAAVAVAVDVGEILVVPLGVEGDFIFGAVVGVGVRAVPVAPERSPAPGVAVEVDEAGVGEGSYPAAQGRGGRFHGAQVPDGGVGKGEVVGWYWDEGGVVGHLAAFFKVDGCSVGHADKPLAVKTLPVGFVMPTT